MPVKYLMPIHLSPHAVQRWRERVGNDRVSKIQGRIRTAVRSAARTGMVIQRGVAEVNVKTGIKAVVAPSLRGGYEVITVKIDYSNKLGGGKKDVLCALSNRDRL